MEFTTRKEIVVKVFAKCIIFGRYPKLALPLFFLVICTNVGYSVVAEFIMQHEDTMSITEALTNLCKRWDKCDIEVGNFMIDCQCRKRMQYVQFSPTVLCICAHSTDFRRGSGGWSTPKMESATIKYTVWHFLEWWVT